MKYDLVIKNGTIVDGTLFPRYVSDIAIRNGVIEKIGHINAPASQTIDASGLIVAPGVIDPHTHYDVQVHWDPYCADSSWNGATTTVIGNCGFGFAPCRPAHRERYMAMMEHTEQVPASLSRRVLNWSWEDFPGWMQNLRSAPKAINLASYLPLNALLIYVMGIEDPKRRMATAGELTTMRDMLNRALDAGACGISFSHMGEGNTHSDSDGSAMPTDVMAIDIAYELCDVLRARDQGVIQTLTEFPGLPDIDRRREVVKEVAKRSQRPTIHTLCMPVDRAPDAHRSILNWLDELEREGVTNVVTQALLGRKWAEIKVPDWTTWDGGGPLFREYSSSGNWDAKVRKARDQDWRNRLRQGYTEDLLMGSGGPLESYTLRNSHGHPRFASGEGKKIGEIAAQHGLHVTDVFFDLVADTNGQADFIITEGVSSDPKKAAEILLHSRAMPGTSDGGAHAMAVNGGHYPTEMIAWVVREHKLVSLEQLHFKLSNHTARFMGFKNRGILSEGYAADLMIYDYDAIDFDLHHLETHFDPPDGSYRRLSRPRGLSWVIVNGQPILKDTKGTGARPGQMISNGGRGLDQALFMSHQQQAAE